MIDIRHGDCLEVLKSLPDNSVDSVLTDPPYGLSFMGKKWDYDVPSEAVWAECLRVLKPGGHLLAFAGTRTQHRMAVRIEDAGFEIRDMIAWVYGTGFPKSLDVSKAIDKLDAADAARQWQGWGTALKPALEPITVARKPIIGTVAANVLEHGTGAINVDGCRVKFNGDGDGQWTSTPGRGANGQAKGQGNAYGFYGANAQSKDNVRYDSTGRWPANLVHDGSDEVVGLFPETTCGSWNGQLTGKGSKHSGDWGKKDRPLEWQGDSGSAARFFYCAKASKRDRGTDNTHPTVKPTDLMRHLCRLVTPPGGVVLDPFMGSGSTGKAAMLEGFQFVGIEREAEYLEIARARIDAARQQKDLFP